MTLSVGMIGLGLMGRPMALNLLRGSFPLVVWNRTRAKAEELACAGATPRSGSSTGKDPANPASSSLHKPHDEGGGVRIAATPREAAEQSDVLITIVSDPPALEEVAWGPGGLLQGLRPGSVHIDSSTVAPALARRLAAACAERGAEFLDAPVTGGTWGAEKGELVFMIGGKKDVLERVRPVLAAMGKKFFHLGPHGAGQTVKLAMNLILALQVDALAEAVALVRGAGLQAEGLLEVLGSSMARAAVLDVKAPLILKGEYPPSFPLRLMHKDLGLALELAAQIGVPLPATAAARETYGAVKESATTDLDYAAVARFWQQEG